MLDRSVQSAESFAAVKQLLSQPLMIAMMILVIWSIAHHFFAGIRFLLIDAEIGVEKSQAQIGSWLVVLAEVIAMLLVIIGVYS